MNATQLFDYIAYFRNLHEHNVLAQSQSFQFCTCSGPSGLQGMLERFRTGNAFFCVDDTCDGMISRQRNGGYFNRRVLMVYLLHRFNIKSTDSYQSALNICRALLQQLMSRMIIDEDDLANEMVYLRTDTLRTNEIGQYFLNGCTGLYFRVEVNEPVDLTFDASQWTQ
jgi:hypothetical protein